ncbi:hypothetical protein M0R45_014897 [Rubus argutus]|uniref:Uncharacterized protein n=1 Tax=Rubus argutus TaxID=59490 RepID=A0AAW1XPB2_RUBAR
MSEVRVEMARGRAKSEKDYHWQPGEEGGRLWVSVDTHLVSCLPCSSGMALLMQVWRWLEGYGWGVVHDECGETESTGGSSGMRWHEMV